MHVGEFDVFASANSLTRDVGLGTQVGRVGVQDDRDPRERGAA